MPWIFLLVSVCGATCTAAAIWPARRPWWLKFPSFYLGLLPNELPLHALAGNAIGVAVFALLEALDGGPGLAGLALTVASSLGLLVLASAHRKAGPAIERALREALGADYATRLDPALNEPLPRSWLVVPWLAMVPARGVERVANVVYATIEGRGLKLDIYHPAARPHSCPVLVEIHGGGWVTGDRRLEARPLMSRLAAHGWVCVSVDYRLSRRATWPDHIVDVKTALAWVREHIAEYGGDPDFVALTGGSSGGHLAALAALSPNDVEYRPLLGTDAPVQACVPFYGVYDFNNSLGLRAAAEMRLFLERPVVKVPLADAPAVYERGTPLTRVNEDAPPFLVIQGTSDNLVLPAESHAFVERLRRTSRAQVAYAEVPRGHHAFDAVPSIRTARTVLGAERFLNFVYAAHRQTAKTPSATGQHSGDTAP